MGTLPNRPPPRRGVIGKNPAPVVKPGGASADGVAMSATPHVPLAARATPVDTRPPPPAPAPVRGTDPLRDLTCQVCGAQPALPVELRQITGFVLAWRHRTWRHVLCRSCGLATGRMVQDRTLLTGWWGVFAIFGNLWAVTGNAIRLVRLRRLDPPRGALRPPLTPGHPVVLRAGTLLTVALVAAASVFALTREPSPSWSTGRCVRFEGEAATPTSCGGAHDGRIVAVIWLGERCPSHAEEYVTLPDDLRQFCIDTDT